VRRSDALWRRTNSGVVVLGVSATRPTIVTGPAADLWELLEAPVRIDDVIDQIARLHGTTGGRVRADVTAVLETWTRDRAIEPLQ